MTVCTCTCMYVPMNMYMLASTLSNIEGKTN